MQPSNITEEELKRALEQVIRQQQEALAFFREILDSELPEGKSRFDLFCEKMQELDNERAQK